jgi:hypothetical protein
LPHQRIKIANLKYPFSYIPEFILSGELNYQICRRFSMKIPSVLMQIVNFTGLCQAYIPQDQFTRKSGEKQKRNLYQGRSDDWQVMRNTILSRAKPADSDEALDQLANLNEEVWVSCLISIANRALKSGVNPSMARGMSFIESIDRMYTWGTVLIWPQFVQRTFLPLYFSSIRCSWPHISQL